MQVRAQSHRFIGILGMSLALGLGLAQVSACGESEQQHQADNGGPTSLVELGIDDGASKGATISARVIVDKETTLSLKTGAEVKITAGSTKDKNLTVTLTRPPDKEALEFVKHTDKKLASAPYVITPHKQTFEKQVEVTLPVASRAKTDKLQVLYLADEKDRDWKVVGKPKVSSSKAKIMVEHFSVLLVVELDDDEPDEVLLPEAGVGPGDTQAPDASVGTGGTARPDAGVGPVDPVLPDASVDNGGGEVLPDAGGSDVSPDAGDTCVPRSCGQLGAECGPVDDGCGGTLDCGQCVGGLVCGINSPNLCDTAPCTPIPSFEACPNKCGELPDGCGGSVFCGACSAGTTCGAGVPNVCGTGPCIPADPAMACAGKCGTVSDQCAGVIECTVANGGEPCSAPMWCGGSGVPNECGGPVLQ